MINVIPCLCDREVACSTAARQGSNFESCVWRTVSSQSSHHLQEVLLAQFSDIKCLYVHKGGLKRDSFYLPCEDDIICVWYFEMISGGSPPPPSPVQNRKMSIFVPKYALECVIWSISFPNFPADPSRAYKRLAIPALVCNNSCKNIGAPPPVCQFLDPPVMIT